MADYVHQEMTRNFILVYLRLFLLIVIKDVFLCLVSYPNKSKNLMDQTFTLGDLIADPPAKVVVYTHTQTTTTTTI